VPLWWRQQDQILEHSAVHGLNQIAVATINITLFSRLLSLYMCKLRSVYFFVAGRVFSPLVSFVDHCIYSWVIDI
jgi:hypothetical protein